MYNRRWKNNHGTALCHRTCMVYLSRLLRSRNIMVAELQSQSWPIPMNAEDAIIKSSSFYPGVWSRLLHGWIMITTRPILPYSSGMSDFMVDMLRSTCSSTSLQNDVKSSSVHSANVILHVFDVSKCSALSCKGLVDLICNKLQVCLPSCHLFLDGYRCACFCASQGLESGSIRRWEKVVVQDPWDSCVSWMSPFVAWAGALSSWKGTWI